jgi:hypothetical protein
VLGGRGTWSVRVAGCIWALSYCAGKLWCRGSLTRIGLTILVLATASFAALSQSTVTTPLPEAPNSSIGYPTVEAALTALRAKTGVHIQEQQG